MRICQLEELCIGRKCGVLWTWGQIDRTPCPASRLPRLERLHRTTQAITQNRIEICDFGTMICHWPLLQHGLVSLQGESHETSRLNVRKASAMSIQAFVW